MKKAKILIVEDDAAICQGLLDVFIFNGFEAVGVGDGQEGLEIALNENFDCLILDVMLPSMDGFSICSRVRKEKPGQPIIMLTAKGAENDIISGFKAGADDYIPKPFSIAELMVRVEALLRRAGKNVGDEEIQFGGFVFCGKTLTVSYNDRLLPLTRREMDIISYLYNAKDRIVSKRELLLEVWHYKNPDIETRTVDIHILKLRKKILSLNPDNQLITTIRAEGYRLEKGA